MTDDTPWLDRQEMLAWMKLAGVLMTVPQAVDTQLRRDSCLNFFEYTILAGLSDAPGRTMQLSTLASMSFGSPSRLSHAVSRLERAGWVERRASCEVRAVVARLTDAGHAKLVEAAPAHVREVRRLVFATLTPEQVGQLDAICTALMSVTLPDSARLVAEIVDRLPPEPDRPVGPVPG